MAPVYNHSNFSGRLRPSLNLALIFDEGHVWHFTMNGTVPCAKEMLFKLPKSQEYHGYSDENGVLYFIQSDTNKPITQFHKKMSKDGHKVISKSALCSKATNEGISKSFLVLDLNQRL